MWLRGMSDAGRQAITERLRDPELMDVRRPVALAEHVTVSAPLVPSDEAMDRYARRVVARQVGPELVDELNTILDRYRREGAAELATILEATLRDLLEVTPADHELARLKWADDASILAERYGRTQAAAAKAAETGRILREKTLPLYSAFALEVGKIIRKYVPASDIERAMTEIRRAVEVSVGQLTA